MDSLSNAPTSESFLMPQQEEEEEEVEEDADFNPFLKVTASSPEASSSLSSEIEGLDCDAVEIMERFSDTRGVKSSNLNTELQKNLTTEFENVEEEEEIASCGTDVNDLESRNRKMKMPTMDLDNEDDAAICTRTRARYSLASCTLDELETFLQETDDEDDLQNIDDEQEYRKFLTAVLHGQENENVDEEDEDNDADFEIELEEALALEGNLEEESARDKKPETRQNKRQKKATTAQYTTKRRLLEQTRRPLCPLLPILPNGPATAAAAALSINHGRIMNPENANASSGSQSFSKKDADLINGFTLHQISQLYCLIHEHVQLLIQVFSLCIYDSSRQHIATQVQGLISQLLQMHNEVLKRKTMSYPSTCFFFPPPYVSRPSSIPDDEVSASSAMVDGTLWVPFVTSPVHSVLDVAPLNLVRRYMDDVCGAVQDSRRRWFHMESSPDDTHLERESLFPLPGDPGFNCELPNRTISSSTVVSSMPSSSPTQQLPKKTLAATLVERTKKHSVALVPKEIAKLAQGFIPLFNPALFPRKPPPAAVVNRVLFTDAEDELLALGMMEYNTDWKAIQQRFLPCKSKHQIFVRRKNRCSSKAADNPIKAVRRMKTCPLTLEEMACIQEGLNVYKSDWMAIWKFFVPHRDPSLLPRQWRIALGTQRSYKQDPEKKEKRRLYESERRKRKADNLPSWQYASERKEHDSQIPDGPNSAEDMCMDNASNANYVHESMAGWRPGVSNDIPGFNLLAAKHPDDRQTERSSHGESQPQTGNIYQSLSASKYSQHLLIGSTPTRGNNSASGGPRSSPYYRPYRGRRANNSAHWVKLAPDLPPVNLPPSVRIVSQQPYKGALHGAPSNAFGAKFNRCSVLKEANESSSLKNNITKLHSERSRSNKDKHAEEESGAHAELDMHPLLFKASEDGQSPYYPSNCYPNSSFTYCSGNQPQLNLSLLHNPHPEFSIDCYNRLSKAKESDSTSCAIDFHPLLQRTEDTNNESAKAFSDERLSSANEKANDLDLEMHLSSLSRKDTVSGDKDLTVHHSIIPIDKSNTYNTNDVGEHSHPEIVMEQEELSDTDEEIEENVEFEHEEMADSEGDELEG